VHWRTPLAVLAVAITPQNGILAFVCDERRKLGLVTRRHRVRYLEPEEPPEPVQTEMTLGTSTPAYAVYGFATRAEFMIWRLSKLKEIDLANHVY
jgi:hypothetical protein